MLKWKCFSLIRLLPPLAEQSDIPWLEAVLFLEQRDLGTALRGAGTG